MKQSKKGVTLVELVVCCGILVLLGAGCTALLMSGQNAFQTGSMATNSQLDVSIAHNQLLHIVPSASNISIVSRSEAAALPAGHSLFFTEEGEFIARSNGKDIVIDSISGFTYEIIRAGETLAPAEPDPTEVTESTEDADDESGSAGYARAQFLYTITTKDGNTFEGGFLLCNFGYDRLIAQLEAEAAVAGRTIDFYDEIDLKQFPVALSIPEETAGAGT